MRGFFESQYVSFKKRHLKNLIALAQTDGEFHDTEKNTIITIGKRYGLKEKQIEGEL